jgi:predicted nucleic acid-binding protein
VILVDTCIWVDHLRRQDDRLTTLLTSCQVLVHPHVIGELALGNLKHRDAVLSLLQNLPQATLASDNEVLQFIGAHRLDGLGIGYVDAHLLASALLTPGARFWTRDKRLADVAKKLGVAAPLH